jgi:type I restriction-modification system DNA methylase subunit
MNLAIRGIEGQISHGDTFHNDRHPDLKADYILANPPFNVSDWRGEEDTISRTGEYEDVPGFCKSATLEEIRAHGHVLTPGRYVGEEAAEEDAEPFEEKMRRLTAQLREQQTEARRLDAAIETNLKTLGYTINE